MNKFKHFITSIKETIAVCLTLFILMAGVLQYAIGLDYVLFYTPLVIGVITALTVLFWNIDHSVRLKVSLAAILIGLISEIIGVNTGLLFGDYTYNNSALGLKILGVPFLVGIMWLLVTVSAWQIASLGGFSKWLTIFLASWIVVIFDLLLEQYATAFGLWKWDDGVIPLLNYLSWFLVSCIIFIIFSYFIKNNKISLYGVSAIPMMMLFFWLMLILV